jgi:hypothetical protein
MQQGQERPDSTFPHEMHNNNLPEQTVTTLPARSSPTASTAPLLSPTTIADINSDGLIIAEEDLADATRHARLKRRLNPATIMLLKSRQLDRSTILELEDDRLFAAIAELLNADIIQWLNNAEVIISSHDLENPQLRKRIMARTTQVTAALLKSGELAKDTLLDVADDKAFAEIVARLNDPIIKAINKDAAIINSLDLADQRSLTRIQIRAKDPIVVTLLKGGELTKSTLLDLEDDEHFAAIIALLTDSNIQRINSKETLCSSRDLEDPVLFKRICDRTRITSVVELIKEAFLDYLTLLYVEDDEQFAMIVELLSSSDIDCINHNDITIDSFDLTAIKTESQSEKVQVRINDPAITKLLKNGGLDKSTLLYMEDDDNFAAIIELLTDPNVKYVNLSEILISSHDLEDPVYFAKIKTRASIPAVAELLRTNQLTGADFVDWDDNEFAEEVRRLTISPEEADAVNVLAALGNLFDEEEARQAQLSGSAANVVENSAQGTAVSTNGVVTTTTLANVGSAHNLLYLGSRS